MEGRVRGAPRGGRRVGGRAVVVWFLTFVALLATPAAIADPPGWDNLPRDQKSEAILFGWCSATWTDPTQLVACCRWHARPYRAARSRHKTMVPCP